MKIWTPGQTLNAADLNKNFSEANADKITVTYDTSDRVATITDTNLSVVYTYTYNDDDQPVTVSDGTTVWTFTYDSAGRLTAITHT